MKKSYYRNINSEAFKSAQYRNSVLSESGEVTSVTTQNTLYNARGLDLAAGCFGTFGTYGTFGTASGTASTFGCLGTYGSIGPS